MDTKFNYIYNAIKDINTTQNKLVTAVNDQCKTLKSFTKKIVKLSPKFDHLDNKYTNLIAKNT